jgi:predicted NAD-dependent protein-ADP-ribosyltransferase YbiA (DUF1768 family)
MYQADLARFTQHADLPATGDAQIVEHKGKNASRDDGGDSPGMNRFGQILMRVREEPRASGHEAWA